MIQKKSLNYGFALLVLCVVILPTSYAQNNSTNHVIVNDDAADDVILKIRGGLYCNISVTNNKDTAVFGIFTYSADAFFTDNSSYRQIGWQVEPHSQLSYVFGVPYFAKITANVSVGDKTLSKEGFSLFWFSIFFKKTST